MVRVYKGKWFKTKGKRKTDRKMDGWTDRKEGRRRERKWEYKKN